MSRTLPFHYLVLILLATSLIGCQVKGNKTQPPQLTFSPSSHVAEASFRGAAVAHGEAVIAGSPGKVLRYSTSSKSWKDITPAGADTLGFRDVEVLSADTYLLMGAGEGAKSLIFKTIDKGENWEIVYQNTHPKGYFNGFDFWDEKTGLLCGDAINNKLYILKTEDGGDTWMRVGEDTLAPFLKGEKGFAASGTGICTVGKGHAWVGTGGPASRVFITEDFGESWSEAKTPIRSGNPESGIFSLAFWDEQQGILAGGNYKEDQASGNNLAITEDGKTWTTPEGSQQIRFRSCVKYLDSERVLATGTSGTAISHDAGENWTELDSVGGFHVFDYDAEAQKGLLADGEGNVKWISFE